MIVSCVLLLLRRVVFFMKGAVWRSVLCHKGGGILRYLAGILVITLLFVSAQSVFAEIVWSDETNSGNEVMQVIAGALIGGAAGLLVGGVAGAAGGAILGGIAGMYWDEIRGIIPSLPLVAGQVKNSKEE